MLALAAWGSPHECSEHHGLTSNQLKTLNPLLELGLPASLLPSERESEKGLSIAIEAHQDTDNSGVFNSSQEGSVQLNANPRNKNSISNSSNHSQPVLVIAHPSFSTTKT